MVSRGTETAPRDELRDSKLNRQNVGEVSQDSRQTQQYPGRDGVQACEWRLTELKGYGVMALVTSKSSCWWFSSLGTEKLFLFHFHGEPEGDSYLAGIYLHRLGPEFL